MSRSLAFLVAGFLAVVVTACGEDAPSFPPVERDSGIQCSTGTSGGDVDAGPPVDGGGMDAGGGATPREEIPCPAGQVCLQGRCYAECTEDAQCSVGEMCSAGVCVARTRPRPDAGPEIDAGPEDPCEVIECEGATPVCHPVSGTCVSCSTTSECVPGNVCDVSRGTCRGFAPRPCSPCDTDVQCEDPGTGTSVGTCTMLEDDYERVCVPTCAEGETCPTGLTCEDGRCLPRVGTCSGFVAAVERRACNADEDCVPFGSVAADGQCEGGGTDGGTGVCLQPCGLATDCPAGMTCTAGFCQPV